MNISMAMVALALGGLAILNIVLALRVHRALRRSVPPLVTDEAAPLGLVVLCLRGGDPFLERSLRLLFQQDYPRYRVRIVLDSEHDSAREYVEAVLADLRPAHVEVMTLTERYSTCTYKMSGILAGTRSLPAGTEFVALMDGDTVPHRTWLRELATPLVNGADCSTGNRWYFPDQPTLGSIVRVCWGVAALTMMAMHRIPWGGTMAFRRGVIEDPHLRHRLQHAFSEDTTIGQFVEETGGRVEFDPRLVILNHESTSVRGFFSFDVRQLLAVKLQHRAWTSIALYGAASAPQLVYPALRLGGMSVHWLCDAAFAAYFLSYASQAILFGPFVRDLVRSRGEELPAWNGLRVVMALLAVPVTQVTHLAALARVMTMRGVVWRGVHYRLGQNPPLVVERDEAERPAPPTVPLARSA